MHAAFAQMNPTVGDLKGNAAIIVEAAEHALELDVDLLVFPPHVLTGWPLRGLADSKAFLEQTRAALDELAQNVAIPCILPVYCAAPQNEEGMQAATEIFVLDNERANSIGMPALAEEGETFGVSAGCDGLGIACESYWPVGTTPEEGDTVLVELCADEFCDGFALPVARGKCQRLKTLAQTSGCFVMHVNLCGAADDVVFGGGSTVFAPNGDLLAACSPDHNEIIVFDTKAQENIEALDPAAEALSPEELNWRAVTLATGDYVRKNGFTDVVIGLSGGIDSAVTAAVAVDALGAEHVHGVLMPSAYSSESSIADAAQLAQNLGIETVELPINGPVDAFHSALAQACGGEVAGLAAENLQARVRTIYLMTLSNAHGWMLLNTGNKSEAAMGFSTLYGDTAGAYAPLGELYKTQVYALARWRKEQGASIPQECIDKAPSAELYPGAKDEDRLPPYDALDAILQAHVEQGKGLEELIAAGFDAELCSSVLKAVKSAEYKRRMEPVAPRVAGASFGIDRAWPITNAWTDEPAQ